jgi:hypothetical protein
VNRRQHASHLRRGALASHELVEQRGPSTRANTMPRRPSTSTTPCTAGQATPARFTAPAQSASRSTAWSYWG